MGWQSTSFIESPVKADGAEMTPFLFFTFESNLESFNTSESVLVLAPKQAHLETFGLLVPSG